MLHLSGKNMSVLALARGQPHIMEKELDFAAETSVQSQKPRIYEPRSIIAGIVETWNGLKSA